MSNQPHKQAGQEIDLDQISHKVKGYISRVNDSFFDMILFARRNAILLIVLLIAGIAAGIYLDGKKTYSHSLYVIPNFGSADYLYAKVDHIQSKIKENDAGFFKQINMGDIYKIEVDPVTDVYSFLEGKENRNYEMLKLLAENNAISEVIEDEMTSRNYKYHLITFFTADPTTHEATVTPLLNYLNDSEYYKVVQKQEIKNLETTITANDTTLKQIDALLNDFSGRRTAGGNTIYYNDNTPLNEVIKLKEELTVQQGINRVERINYEKIIKDSNIVLNNRNFSVLKMKFVLPLLFIAIFVGISLFRSYYKRQLNKRKIIITE